MRIWLLVLALAVAAAGIVLFVLAREQPAPVTMAPPPPRDAPAPRPTPVAIDAKVTPPVDAAVIDAAPAAELETLRSSGAGHEAWVPQAGNLLRGFDPTANVECYVAGCAALITFDSDDAYEHAVQVTREDQTWTGGKKWLSPTRVGTKITAVLILYRPD